MTDAIVATESRTSSSNRACVQRYVVTKGRRPLLKTESTCQDVSQCHIVHLGRAVYVPSCIRPGCLPDRCCSWLRMRAVQRAVKNVCVLHATHVVNSDLPAILIGMQSHRVYFHRCVLALLSFVPSHRCLTLEAKGKRKDDQFATPTGANGVDACDRES